MQSWPKTAVKRGLHLWEAQSSTSDISPEWRERTQHGLDSELPAHLPCWSLEKHCPLALPWSPISEELPPSFLPSGRPPELPKGSGSLTWALVRAQTKTRGRIKTQARWERGSSKNEIRINLHTAHLPRGTSPLDGSSLAPTKGLIFVFHQSCLHTKLPGVFLSTPYSSPLHNWKLPMAERIWQQTRDTTFSLEIQPARKECRWSHHKANVRPLFQLSQIIHNFCDLASGKNLGKHMGFFLYFQLCHAVSLSNSYFCFHMIFLWHYSHD